jgi:AMP-binding enzyme
MIAGPPADHPVRATLDDLFRRAHARRPDATALVDPPDRAMVTDGAPRSLTYAEADRAVSALAERLRGFGLSADAVVALQLPNTVESVIALLAVVRAGMIAAPLPLLWRQADAAAALARVGARALIGCRHIGEVDYGEITMQLAAETFSIRFVGAFGDNLPDGVVPLDDIFLAASDAPARERNADAADHAAVVTFDVTADGIMPMARSHAELIAGGLAVHLEARIEGDATLIGTLALSSFAGLATTLVPWLLAGGTLALHHPFSPKAFAAQRMRVPRAVTVLPGPLVGQLADAGLIGGDDDVPVLTVWRAPERLAGSTHGTGCTLTDIAVFGELGLIVAVRSAGSRGALPSGALTVPRGAADGIHVLDVTRSAAGTLVLSGPMVPRLADGDTHYPCRIDRDTGLMTIDGPPAGLVSVGGYRFALGALQDLIGGIEDGGTLAALPDMLAGHRLAGTGADRNAICDALLAQGANPLLVAAFRARRTDRAA